MQQLAWIVVWANWLLRGLGLALFVLFAVWFARVVRLSVQQAPRYAVFGYGSLIFCLALWGLALFYPFPVRNWREALWRDVAFHGGVAAPAAALLIAAMIKLAISAESRARLRQPRHRAKLALAMACFIAFPVWFGAFVVNDARDLCSEPLQTSDTVWRTFRGYRSGQASVTFATVGELRLPHGLWFRAIEPGHAYQILYTPHGRVLVGVRPAQ